MKTFQSISILFLLSLFLVALLQLPAYGKAVEVVKYYNNSKPGTYTRCITIDLKFIKWTWCWDRSEPTVGQDTASDGTTLDGPPAPGGIS